ncbi:hypothetical protein AAFF_G00054070 [Aldrovandia affinis]|uniref:Uncharacterized protein n=1 Tax=Aldrovandia affinis TaxID=143900 RepID=A0AAD7WEP9_9TELE|nr:hypothetical protein AAFF_G00054070 [Aldrovandia affinis]
MRSLCIPCVLMCLVVNAQAEKPRPTPCQPPMLFQGKFKAVIGKNTTLIGDYFNDAYGQRFRMRLSFPNQTVALDQLTLFREKVMYDISYEHQTCENKPVNVPFPPMAVPRDAEFVHQFVLGSSSEPGQGILLNVWSGTDPHVTGRYEVTTTDLGCLPVGTRHYAEGTGWHTTVFYDAVYGIEDPNVFIPPSFCKTSQAETNTDKVDG